MAKVMWAKALEYSGDAGCLADTILDAVNDPAFASAVMSVRADCQRWDYITGVTVVCEEDEPEETTLWEVYLVSGPVPAIGDIVI